MALGASKGVVLLAVLVLGARLSYTAVRTDCASKAAQVVRVDSPMATPQSPASSPTEAPTEARVDTPLPASPTEEAVTTTPVPPSSPRMSHPRQAFDGSEPRLMEPGAFYAQATCEDMHPTWTRKPEPVTTRVINSFLYNGEADLLEIKLYELFDVMDLFVVVESKMDFRGRPKPIYFNASDPRWAPYASKVDHFIIDFGLHHARRASWGAEERSRELLNEHLHQIVNVGDVVICGDLDELPRREVVRLLKVCDAPAEQKPMKLFFPHLYYHLGCLMPNEPWAVLVHWATGDKHRTVFTQRNTGPYGSKFAIADGGWHMSWMFRTVAEFQHKLRTFSHTELDNAFYQDPKRIREEVCNNRNIFNSNRHCTTRYIDHNKELPHLLLDYPSRMLYLRPNRCQLEQFQ